jgi:hypothetical protein
VIAGYMSGLVFLFSVTYVELLVLLPSLGVGRKRREGDRPGR